ncbi:transcriptional regulator [Rhizobium altiplani]|uniref:Transcriptional regulator n=2 Tax=Rhizobium altiplani TaxID=1864509 RepID=A0A125Q7S8_9HYPH|nr:transcriptional regulator [Rhizobium altiplani]
MVAKESVRSSKGNSESESRQKVSRSDELREALEEMIITGRLPPGARIDEGALVEQFQVSRTPMREAIKALIATGMLEMRPRQGVSVAAISIPKLMEMFETMANLEGMCAKYAARRATPDEIAQLLEIQGRLEEELGSNNPDRFYEINGEFHELLYDASHTEFIADQTRMLRRRVSMYRRHVTYLPGRMAATIGEHGKIIDAIKAKDPSAAATAATEHLNLLGDDMVDFIARLTRTMDVYQ